jgi:hypothetical protein
MAANPEMPTPKPSFMYILSNSGEWPNLITMSTETKELVNSKWDQYFKN